MITIIRWRLQIHREKSVKNVFCKNSLKYCFVTVDGVALKCKQKSNHTALFQKILMLTNTKIEITLGAIPQKTIVVIHTNRDNEEPKPRF